MGNPGQEIITIVDRHNRVTGTAPRRVMRRDNLIHRASYILVFNHSGKLFIQKRSMSKDIYHGYCDLAAGGVVLANESYEQSAMRELKEELGVSNVSLTYHFDYFFHDVGNRVWGGIFTCCHQGPFKLQEEEIDEGRFASVEEIVRINRSAPFTPDGLPILNRLLTTTEIIRC
jgi:isopentenyldiphosphate isomerase